MFLWIVSVFKFGGKNIDDVISRVPVIVIWNYAGLSDVGWVFRQLPQVKSASAGEGSSPVYDRSVLTFNFPLIIIWGVFAVGLKISLQCLLGGFEVAFSFAVAAFLLGILPRIGS